MSDDLIARLGKLSGPDRECDAQIALATNEVPSEGHRPCAAVDVGTFGVGSYGYWKAPAYTASIDAAMTLVPEGHIADTQERRMNSALFERAEESWAQIESIDGGGTLSDATAQTVAIALCIAALKARSRSSRDGGGE